MSNLSRFVANRRYEPYDVYVGRPTKWGNPFSHLVKYATVELVATRDEAVDRYKEWLLGQPDLVAAAKRELRGKVLGCWCKPARCHAEVLAEIANVE